jgi:hypothetical protein
MQIKSKVHKDATIISSEEIYFDENGIAEVQDEELAEAMLKDFPSMYSRTDEEVKPAPKPKAKASEGSKEEDPKKEEPKK